MELLTNTPEWNELQRLAREDIAIATMLAEDKGRVDSLSFTHTDPETHEKILFDFSKNKISGTVLDALVALAEKCSLAAKIDSMFAGDKINTTENRAVLHTALRNIKEGETKQASGVYLDGANVMDAVVAELEKIKTIADCVRSGRWKGHTGKTITDIVNIGIGGSDLGPKMVCNALRGGCTQKVKPHFVSNIDGNNIELVLESLCPEQTLVVVVSKTFTTAETITNALSARKWLVSALGDEKAVEKHFMAVSTNKKKVTEFGIDEKNMVGFWDWVGGRYSVWSAVGISVALTYGFEVFAELLRGAHNIDCHFHGTPLHENIPVLMGLLCVWYNNFCGAETTAILPYEHTLALLPAYLQQADMESCGKQRTKEGVAVTCQTGTVLWGDEATNGQHAFFQLLHQGTKLVPCDFIAGVNPQRNSECSQRHHDMLLSNFFAQTEALLAGKNIAKVQEEMEHAAEMERLRVAPHRVFPGNRPSTSILYDKLTPRTLGALVAVYEHKIFTQAAIWNINAFDQWGVELGKQLAVEIQDELERGVPGEHDQSTAALLKHFRENRRR
ncbi:MAG: glucose-6-phosphate isomerase [Amphiamblys sp. WSBS2006]|nr:MAG: glucose-6-phosphate isomerase [Amphiamblys sp. WSBS2006]